MSGVDMFLAEMTLMEFELRTFGSMLNHEHYIFKTTISPIFHNILCKPRFDHSSGLHHMEQPQWVQLAMKNVSTMLNAQ